MRVTVQLAVLGAALSFAVSLLLFFGTPGLLGPYGQPGDLYHFAILTALLFVAYLVMVGSLVLHGRRRR